MSAPSGFTLARRLRQTPNSVATPPGEPVFAVWCTLPSPLIVETIGREGFAVVLDQQHGLWDTASIIAAIAAAHQGGAAPIVRIPVGDFASVSRVLDFGAEGIIAPMINSAADAQALVEAAKFPPLGARSWGPQRAMTFAGMSNATAYLRGANDLCIVLAMIETRKALENLAAIVATPGIDGVFVGPFDLSIGLTAGASIDPDGSGVDAALTRIAEATGAARKIAGVYCQSSERALTLAGRGFRFVSVGSDVSFLRTGLAASLASLKGQGMTAST
jgi:4-hydroxy-2-oxoheptanedioate aldolase